MTKENILEEIRKTELDPDATKVYGTYDPDTQNVNIYGIEGHLYFGEIIADVKNQFRYTGDWHFTVKDSDGENLFIVTRIYWDITKFAPDVTEQIDITRPYILTDELKFQGLVDVQ